MWGIFSKRPNTVEPSMKVQDHLRLLGLRVKDRVTGLSGTVSSVNFDLYGCIQACINPGLDKDGKPFDLHWYDISRLEVLSTEPVMTQPNYDFGHVAEGRHGAAEKPAPRA